MKKTFRSRLVLLSLSAVAIAAGLGVYSWLNRDTQPQYRMQAVEKGDVSQTVSANGTINPVTLVSVGTQVSGTVKKLYVDFNSKVKKGQILLELDDALLAAQVKQSVANVQSAQAAMDLAAANEKRSRDLFAQEYVAQQDLDTAVEARQSAQAQFVSARAQLERDRANLAYSIIRSPVSGVVVDREVDVGQTVAASLQTPTLFKIAQDLSRMQIDSSFAEADIGGIRVGQTVRFTVDAFPDQQFRGEVKQVRLNPTTVSNVVTYDVVVNVNNPGEILLPGMTAYVNIAVTERKNALLVPNAALRFRPPVNAVVQKSADQKNGTPLPENPNNTQKIGSGSGGSANGASIKPKQDGFSGKVYIAEQDGLKPISVLLGITDNRNTEVTGGGLKSGDQVVVGVVQAADKSSGSGGRPMRLF